MKAFVQYSEFDGYCAANISDHESLADILKEWGVNTDRYYPVGVSFRSGDYGDFDLTILCYDTMSENKDVIKICYDREPGYSASDIQAMFKRFHAILAIEDIPNSKIDNAKEIHIE